MFRVEALLIIKPSVKWNLIHNKIGISSERRVKSDEGSSDSDFSIYQ